jgi:oxygen-independent coproporphyrinogen-3 oxidase
VRPIDEQEALSLDVLAREYVMLRLRTSDGLDLGELEERYGVDLLDEKIDELALLESGDFIKPIRNQKVVLSDLGKTVCNSVTERLLPAVSPKSS